VNLDEQQSEAQAFLDWYITGVKSPAIENQFPGNNDPGIRFRRPARVDIRPERQPLPDELDNQEISAGEGPEVIDEPYVLIDACALQRAKVSLEGQVLRLRFIFVNRFPPGKLEIAPTLLRTAMLPFSCGVGAQIVDECVDLLEEYLGSDGEFQPRFDPVIELLSLEDFNERVANGDL
jgi:hypothetical protein